MPRRKTVIELRREVAAREETLRKLHQRLMALDAAIMQAEDDAYALLCFEIGQLAASCGLTAIPLADLEVLFEALAAQWEAQQHRDTEAEP